MENKRKSLIITIILLVIVIVALVGYICYDKGVFGKKESSENNSVENTSENEIIKTDEYKMLSDDNKMYLVKKDNMGYKVLYSLGDNIHYIGIYNNKFYYSDTKIKYIDLTDSNLTENVWLEIPQPECLGCTGMGGKLIWKSAIIDDTLYFRFDSFAAGAYDTDGLLSISMNASNFAEFKQISPFAEEWFADENNKSIYYMNFYRDDNAVYRYNVSSSESEKLFNTNSFLDHIDYISNNIIYYNNTKDELSLFDVNSKTSTILSSNLKSVTSANNNMWGISSVVGKNLYYYDGNGNIMKYDSTNQSTTNYYKIDDTFYYRGYDFYNDDNFEITYDCYKHSGNDQGHTCTKTKDYVSNGKIVEQLPSINVTMLDGTSKSFTIQNFQ